MPPVDLGDQTAENAVTDPSKRPMPAHKGQHHRYTCHGASCTGLRSCGGAWGLPEARTRARACGASPGPMWHASML